VSHRQQFCLEMRKIEEDGSSVGRKDIMSIRIMTLGENETLSSLKIEISSE
jgi:hypothetical protein